MITPIYDALNYQIKDKAFPFYYCSIENIDIHKIFIVAFYDLFIWIEVLGHVNKFQ
jgi:hypothetical protein